MQPGRRYLAPILLATGLAVAGGVEFHDKDYGLLHEAMLKDAYVNSRKGDCRLTTDEWVKRCYMPTVEQPEVTPAQCPLECQSGSKRKQAP